MSFCTTCRICKSKELLNIFCLGKQSITSRFPKYGDFTTPVTSITLDLCDNCGLLQLRETTDSKDLYEQEYGYRSGINNTMKQHLQLYQEEILQKVSNISDGDVIIDIGSNDSTMLQNYSNKLKRIGIDPTGKQFFDYYGDVELLPTYFTLENFTKTYGNIKAKVISSISMFYDLPDPVKFAQDIYEILDDDGIWTAEQSYLVSMLKRNSIDTICHEHLEYYALSQIKLIADMSKFKIIDIKFNDCNGGSFRIYFAKQLSGKYTEATQMINEIITQETEYGITKKETYYTFFENCNKEINYLKKFIENANTNGKKIYIYGASTKGNCLLQYANINETDIKYAVERNPNKVGKMTSTGIEIISEETMRLDPPDYLLCLPYHFKDEILKRETKYMENGGQFIFPLPNFEIIGSKPKLLITGCDGMIANHMKNSIDFCNSYNFYGIGHTNPLYEKNINKYYFDLNDREKTEFVINTIKPDIIVHLAGLSNSQYCFNNPIETLHTNGMITANICDIIHKNKLKTKLFNSSSSEMYKGHVDYEVKQNDTHLFHLHPYSIAKIMGHSLVNFYQTTYGLPFFNGVFFTIESPLKKNTFLMNKISTHIVKWLSGVKTPLHVGSLESYRNILDADKAVDLIFKIISLESGGDYLICNDVSLKVYDLVIRKYNDANIVLYEKDNILYEKNTNLAVIVINNNISGLETIPTNIRGFPSIQ